MKRAKKIIAIPIYALIVLIVLAFPLAMLSFILQGNQYRHFSEYKTILGNHNGYPTDDFDQDGLTDMIVYTGCALLTATKIEDIPDEERCTVSDIPAWATSEKNIPTIGQKFVSSNEYDLNTKDFEANPTYSLAHIGLKEGEGEWTIIVTQNGDLYSLKIDRDGRLVHTEIDNNDKRDRFIRVANIYLQLPMLLIFAVAMKPFSSTAENPATASDMYRIHPGIIVAVSLVLLILSAYKGFEKGRSKKINDH